MYRFTSLLAAYATAIQLSLEVEQASNCVSSASVDCSIWPTAMMPQTNPDAALRASDFPHGTVFIWLHGAGGAPSDYQ
jgi:hypothetical protein